MKFGRVILSSLASMATLTSAFEPVTEQIEVFPSEYGHILDLVNEYVNPEAIHKRDASSSIQSILVAVANSGLINNTLNEVAGSPILMNTISETIINVINGTNITALTSGDANLPINVTQLWDTINSSGLIDTALNDLLVNDTNRHELAVWTGKLLCSQPAIPKILVDLGNGQALTWDYLHDVILNTKAKAPNTVGPTLKSQVVFGGPATQHSKRDGNSTDQYAGSASAFLNNIIGTVVQSQLFTNTINDTLVAVNNSGILFPVTMQVLNNPNLGAIAGNISSQVYNSGVLNKIDLNYYYSWAKKKGYLKDGVQTMLVNPTYSPSLGKFFQQLDESGVYKQIQYNLFGAPKN